MIFAVIWFSCALVSFWLWSWVTYNDCSVMTKRDFIDTLALCILAAPLMLAGLLIGIVVEYLDAHGKRRQYRKGRGQGCFCLQSGGLCEAESWKVAYGAHIIMGNVQQRHLIIINLHKIVLLYTW